MKIALIPHMTRKNAPDVTKQVLKELENLGVSVFLSSEFSSAFSKTDYITFCDIESAIAESDVVITVGGDGLLILSFICRNSLNLNMNPCQIEVFGRFSLS